MSSDYDVGHKRPPAHTRFKKGKSGNPNGRPKGTKNLKTDLLEELQESVLIREGPTKKQISKQRAMVKSLMARAIKGDARATTTVISMMARLFDIESVDNEEPPLTENELAVFATLQEEFARRAQQDKEPDPEDEQQTDAGDNQLTDAEDKQPTDAEEKNDVSK